MISVCFSEKRGLGYRSERVRVKPCPA